MSFYSALFKSCLFPLYEGKLRGRSSLAYMREYDRNILLGREGVGQLQQQKLVALLTHCQRNIPFYMDLQDKHFATGADLYRDFAKLPLMDKSLMTEHYQQLCSVTDADHSIVKTTGGSTGQPFKFELSQESLERRQAVMWRGYGALGAAFGEKLVYLWGVAVGKQSKKQLIKEALYHRFYNRIMLNCFIMSAAAMQRYVAQINRHKPTAIVAYTSPVYELARYVLDNKLSVHSPLCVLTGAEPLYEFQRQTIQQAFNCPVYNTYGCREFMLIASECKLQQGLHINADHLLVEVVDDNGRPVIDQQGDLVITDLHNYRMPFVRYKNGDQGILSSSPCACGSPFPLLKEVSGRKLDIIRTLSGASLPGEFFPHMLKDVPGVSRFQVWQFTLDAILIKVVATTGFGESQKTFIRDEIVRQVGENLRVDFEVVDDIPLTQTGKHRVTISKLVETAEGVQSGDSVVSADAGEGPGL